MKRESCTGKPAASPLHKWGPIQYTGDEYQEDGATWKTYVHICELCGAETQGERSEDALIGVFSLPAIAHAMRQD